jgi:hypothetical protein
MLQPLRTNAAREQTSRMRAVPAPVRGWNARDSVASMKPDDALILDNIFPEASECVLRGGSSNHRTGGTAAVYSLMAYHGSGATNKLFAAAGTSIFDVTTADTSFPAASVSSTVNAQWQHVQVGTSAGQYLICVNGAVNPRRYDGSSWVDMDNTVLTGSADQTTFIHVNHWKRFVFFIAASSMSAWYLPAGSVGGAEVELPLGGVFKLGGYLMAMGTWTLDAGEGVDDHAVFVSSEGEVAVYKGTDPSSANTWALVGTWRLGRPIGRRCFQKLAGDLVLLTTDGFVPLSRALTSETFNPSVAISDRIRTALSDAIRTYGSNYGWQPIFYPSAPALLFNVPRVSTSSSVLAWQYVMNTTTGAWCRFSGWDAYCFETLNGVLYYGGYGVVRKAWTGQGDLGVNITGEAKQAFSDYGVPGAMKQFKLARPLLQTDGDPGLLLAMNVDYRDDAPTGVLSAAVTGAPTWAGSTWGGTVWQGGLTTVARWAALSSIGVVGALRLKVATKDARVRWSATDVVYERGGIL